MQLISVHLIFLNLIYDLANHFAGSELEMMQFKYAAMFQAGWFIESMWSQTLVIHMIRTPKLPFIQSRASLPLTLLTFKGIAVLIIVVFENAVFWSMKKKVVTTDDFLFALRNGAELETIEKLYENSSEKFMLLKNADFYLEEALRFLYRNFEFSENVTDDRKFLMLALENSNPDITRLYLDNCVDK